MSAAMANGLAFVVDLILNMIQLMVIASIAVSWVGGDPRNPLVQIIRNTTEPLYRPFRKLTSAIPGPFDWAPFILILIVVFLQKSVGFYLHRLAMGTPSGM